MVVQKFFLSFWYLYNFVNSRFCSVVDRHRFDANPDSDPNFHVDADPDPDPDWHQNDADLYADSTPSFTHFGIFFTFSHSFAILQCFIFLISVKDVQIFSILDSIM
jgi:hypothetical protein